MICRSWLNKNARKNVNKQGVYMKKVVASLLLSSMIITFAPLELIAPADAEVMAAMVPAEMPVEVSAEPEPEPEPAYENEQMAYIADVALQYDLSPELVFAVIETESRWKADADNGIAIGLMQLNRNTYPWLAREVGIQNPDPFNWQHNVRMGIWYLDYLRDAAINEGYTDEDALFTMLIYYNRGPAGGKKWMRSNSMYDNGYANKVVAMKHEFEKKYIKKLSKMEN